MNKLRVLFLGFLLVVPLAFVSVASSMDEKDIPPPPMPEYMKKHQVKMDEDNLSKRRMPTAKVEETISEDEGERDVASQPVESFEGQSAESIKDEFLNAGDEESQSDEQSEVAADTPEPSIEGAAEEEQNNLASQPAQEPSQPQPVAEVNEVEEPSQEPVQETAQEENQEPVNPETLADVEETLEEAEKEAEVIADGGRKPSAKVAFKAGMYKFDKECTMYSEPRSLSDQAGSVPVGRKLWLDPHNENWHKAYKKSGTVYIPSECLQ